MTTNNPGVNPDRNQSIPKSRCCFSSIKSSLCDICFCKSALFTSGLVFSYKLAEKLIVSVFITYFTEYSSTYNLKKAAAVTNYQEALSASLEVFMFYVAKVFSNHFMILIFCLIVSYAGGMGLFAFTASNVSEFSVTLFDVLSIIGLTMVAVGRAGFMPFIRGFTIVQLFSHEQNRDIDKAMVREKVLWRVTWFVGSLVSIPLFIFFSWIPTFIITAVVMVLAFVVFMFGYKFYHNPLVNPVGRRPFTTIRVVMAALLNRHFPYPSSPNHFFKEDEVDISETELWPQVKWLRWVDKAAIIESPLQQIQQQRESRLFYVTEVQGSKYILKMVPMWCAFPGFGLILSVGNTFFAQQAEDLMLSYHLIFLLILQSLLQETISSLSTLLLSVWYLEAKQKRSLVKIWAGILMSILCCYVVWQVESRRLHVAAKWQSLEYPSETMPMSVWWLAPQFCLLGLMEGLAVNGLEEFTIEDDHLSLSMKNFLKSINGFVVAGIGSILNMIFVYSSNTLFHNTLNRSRLDLYFKYLTYYGPIVNIPYLLFISVVIYGSHVNS